MSTVAHDSAGADESVVRAHAAELRRLASDHGVSALRYASPGTAGRHLDRERDVVDAIAFETAATDLLGAEVELFSDAVLGKANVSPDLAAATSV